MVRVLVGVVEGNRFAENAREWSPAVQKLKQCLNSVPRGFLELVTDVPCSVQRFFLFRPHQYTLNKIPDILIPHSGGLCEAHCCDFVPPDFFLTNHITFQT